MKRAGAEDAPLPVPYSSPAASLLGPGRIRAEEGWSGFLSSDSTSCSPAACCCPFSSFPHSHREKEAPQLPRRHPPGREIQRTAQQILQAAQSHGPPWRWPWPPTSPSGLLQLFLPCRWENVCACTRESLLGNTCGGISKLEHCVQIFIC